MMEGWQEIDGAFLEGLKPLDSAGAVRFYDGIWPTWRHAVSRDHVPARSIVSDVVAALREEHDEPTVQLILGAGGEGKTTAMLQAAADLVRGGDWRVSWREDAQTAFDVEQAVGDATDGSRWLYVADDAETLADDVYKAVRQLHGAHRRDIHFLLAARDTDWQAANASKPAFGSCLKTHLLRALSRSDAEVLVRAWRTCGADGLRALTPHDLLAQQVDVLLDAAREGRRDGGGSFYGAALAARFSPADLRNHMTVLLARLSAVAVIDPRTGATGRNLADALLYLAACHHSSKAHGLRKEVLATVLGIDPHRVMSAVGNPLGQEAPVGGTGWYLLTRHLNVAHALLVAGHEGGYADLGELWAEVIRTWVKVGPQLGYDPAFSPAVHIGPRLFEALPEELPQETRRAAAITAARAAAESMPDRLVAFTSLVTTYRQNGCADDAARECRTRVSTMGHEQDYAKTIRGFWFEWGVCEGERENHAADAWLQAVSLSDRRTGVPLTSRNAMLSCAGLGVAFAKLAGPGPDDTFHRARRAVTYLGRLSDPNQPTVGYYDRYDDEEDAVGTRHPTSVDEAVDWLAEAAEIASQQLTDRDLQARLAEGPLTFRQLRDGAKARFPEPRHG